jgi:hypothetical protein
MYLLVAYYFCKKNVKRVHNKPKKKEKNVFGKNTWTKQQFNKHEIILIIDERLKK